MPPKIVLKYILDLEQLIGELEDVVQICESDYLKFSTNFMAIRAAERNLELIGEVVRQMQKISPMVPIKHAKEIIGMRNLLAHSYDNIDPTVLWKILLNKLPDLKEEILNLKAN